MKNCDICNQPIRKNAIWCDTCGRKVSWGYKPAGVKLQEDSVEEPKKVESSEKTSVIEKERTEEKRPSNITEESLIERDTNIDYSRTSAIKVIWFVVFALIVFILVGVIIAANTDKYNRSHRSTTLSSSYATETTAISTETTVISTETTAISTETTVNVECDTLTFGNYNGSPIEWRVLDVQDGRMLVITSDAVCRREYNESFTDITWENCSLREWLNEDFFNEAFTSEEQGRIITTIVTADANPGYDTNPGNDTEDRVFLLSIDEANRYFASNEDRVCQYNSSSCYWWLRSPGRNSSRAAAVSYDGSVICPGFYHDGVDSGGLGVRPALWINLES